LASDLVSACEKRKKKWKAMIWKIFHSALMAPLHFFPLITPDAIACEEVEN
jgi:hypothetical protein